MSRSKGLRGYAVWSVNDPEIYKEVNDLTLGKAKSRLWHEARESWPELRWVDLRGRLLATPIQSERHAHVCRLRGRPDLEAGCRVLTEHQGRLREGTIGDVTSGACFWVVMDTGERWVVHPHDLRSFSAPEHLRRAS